MARPNDNSYTLNKTTVVSQTPPKTSADMGLTAADMGLKDITDPAEIERLNKLNWQTFEQPKNSGTRDTDIREVTDPEVLEKAGVAIKVKKQESVPDTSVTPAPSISAQEKGAQMLQDRINSGNMQGTAEVEVPTVAKVTDPATTTPKNVYLYDWGSGMSMADAYKQGKHNRGDILRDRERWGKDNDNPVNILEAMDMVPENHDPRKTYQENELEEKRRKRQENWEKIGNFLSHLGNFVGAAGWGGSVQGLEHPKELTARQQVLRDKTEALRSAYNKSYFENYYKQRSEELKQQNQNRLERQYDLMVRKQDWKEKYDTGILDSKKEALRLKEDYNNKLISLREYEDGIKMINALANKQRANTSSYNAHNPKDYVVEKEETTPFGKKKTTTRKTHGNSGGGKSLGLGIGQ